MDKVTYAFKNVESRLQEARVQHENALRAVERHVDEMRRNETEGRFYGGTNLATAAADAQRWAEQCHMLSETLEMMAFVMHDED